MRTLHFLFGRSKFVTDIVFINRKTSKFILHIPEDTLGPQHQKRYLWTCTPSKDSDQPKHSRSLISFFFFFFFFCFFLFFFVFFFVCLFFFVFFFFFFFFL